MQHNRNWCSPSLAILLFSLSFQPGHVPYCLNYLACCLGSVQIDGFWLAQLANALDDRGEVGHGFVVVVQEDLCQEIHDDELDLATLLRLLVPQSLLRGASTHDIYKHVFWPPLVTKPSYFSDEVLEWCFLFWCMLFNMLALHSDSGSRERIKRKQHSHAPRVQSASLFFTYRNQLIVFFCLTLGNPLPVICASPTWHSIALNMQPPKRM